MIVELSYPVYSIIQQQHNDDKWRQTWVPVHTDKPHREKNRHFKRKGRSLVGSFDLLSALFFSQITVGLQRKHITKITICLERGRKKGGYMDLSQGLSLSSGVVYWQVASRFAEKVLTCPTFREDSPRATDINNALIKRHIPLTTGRGAYGRNMRMCSSLYLHYAVHNQTLSCVEPVHIEELFLDQISQG